MTNIVRIALIVAGITGALVHAPSAAAEPDVEFCKAMTAVGYSGDCATLAGLARDVCAEYDRGVDWTTVLTRVDLATKDEGLSNFIMAGAPLYFCPEHDDKT